MSDVVIKVKNLFKEYRLGTISHGTLQQDLQSWWARMRGKEDPNAQIQTHNISVNTNNNERFWALKDVSFEVKNGEALGIIGRNGTGKSTLLKILSRITSPTSGSVKIRGRVSSLLEVGTGFHPELTGRENIFLNGSILGMTREEIKGKFDEIVEFSGIEKFLDTPVKRYSSGMYVRLAFAVAAHLEPEILVVDEVLSVGDAEFQEKCLGKMSEVSQSGRTIIFVSHNMIAVRNLCPRVILLDYGRVVAEGNASAIISQYLNRDNQEGAILSSDQLQKLQMRMGNRSLSAVQFREIRLQDKKGNLRNHFYSDEEIGIQVTYECRTKILDMALSIIVMDEYRQPILNVSNKNHLNAVYAHEKGVYQASCVFPANFFGGKKFLVSIKMLLPGYGKLVTPPVLGFEVDFTGLYGKGWSVCPRLPILVTSLNGESAFAQNKH